jgi:hypothetical protein
MVLRCTFLLLSPELHLFPELAYGLNISFEIGFILSSNYAVMPRTKPGGATSNVT